MYFCIGQTIYNNSHCDIVMLPELTYLPIVASDSLVVNPCYKDMSASEIATSLRLLDITQGQKLLKPYCQ